MRWAFHVVCTCITSSSREGHCEWNVLEEEGGRTMYA